MTGRLTTEEKWLRLKPYSGNGFQCKQKSRYNYCGGGIGRRLNKVCDNKIAAPVEVQFHKVVVAYLDRIM